VADWSTTRILAVLATAFAALALALFASILLLNPYPDGASCYTEQGYASIKDHASANASLATFALLFTAVSGLTCVVGIARAAGHRLAFALGLVPLFVIGWLAVAVLIISGLNCQN
jgi:archaellum biogenesis protein FlaJ (TadC family)